MVTARDAAHKWMMETFIKGTRPPGGDDLEVHERLKELLNGSAIYHCGPVVAGVDSGAYKFVAAGPTTSTREEPYQAEVMKHFNVKGVIGKGGMGEKTLRGCQETPGVYFHAIGGAATFLAERVVRVLEVFKLKEFGVPEALWVIEVKEFPVVVTMDSHGGSLHADMAQKSRAALEGLLEKPY
jgi:fumarate hydratase class I